ncbi:MAG: plasmid stability protein [Acidobacteria bacterium]|nr:plasmid stability protein [Acidobacteriota bacterium]
MANLTLKQVPEDLYRRLKDRAAVHRRSINNEAIICLEQALEARPFEPRAWLDEVRTLRRQTPKVFLDEATLKAAKSQGRP